MKRSILLLRIVIGAAATAAALFAPFLLSRYLALEWNVHVPGLVVYVLGLVLALWTFQFIAGRQLSAHGETWRRKRGA